MPTPPVGIESIDGTVPNAWQQATLAWEAARISSDTQMGRGT